jgi:hypothetical protein
MINCFHVCFNFAFDFNLRRYNLDRGYEGLDAKLVGLGAVIRRHPM